MNAETLSLSAGIVSSVIFVNGRKLHLMRVLHA